MWCECVSSNVYHSSVSNEEDAELKVTHRPFPRAQLYVCEEWTWQGFEPRPLFGTTLHSAHAPFPWLKERERMDGQKTDRTNQNTQHAAEEEDAYSFNWFDSALPE